MPIINKQDLSKAAGAAPGLETCLLVSAGQGSQSLHIEEVTVAPNARIPRCINPHTEVAIIVQEGRLDAILGRVRMTIGPGHTVLAPAGTAHGFLNRSEEPARVLFIFPTHQVLEAMSRMWSVSRAASRVRFVPRAVIREVWG